jgi:hypothetical protein
MNRQLASWPRLPCDWHSSPDTAILGFRSSAPGGRDLNTGAIAKVYVMELPQINSGKFPSVDL